MRVYITQGHENGIGLEVFFKTCLLFTKTELGLIKLLAFPEAVKRTLSLLKIPFQILPDSISLAGELIQVEWQDNVNTSQSFTALLRGMALAETGGILYTLPTSKDQFPRHAGHTEYFRDHYHKAEIGMFFSSPTMRVLLITDHLPVNALSEALTEDVINDRLSEALTVLTKWNWPINRVLISGLNPHAGEKGLIGHEDTRVERALIRLRSIYKIEMSGPLPGDTMLLEKKSKDDVLVYLFHDQGLGVFKGLQGFVGSNITLGLPYPRFSPDHGTSFSLFGKNTADYRGCAFSLREALAMLKKVTHAKDSSHKSQSP